MEKITLNNKAEIQSPYLYNQAVGSNQTDGCPRGVFTRWDLMGNLAEQHIPKGNLFTSRFPEKGFNKTNDFVQLYRAKYANAPQIVIPFWLGILENVFYSSVNIFNNNSGFSFDVNNPNDNSKPKIRVIVRFLDLQKAQAIMSVYNSLDTIQKLKAFLEKYDGITSIELENRLMYKFSMKYTSGQLRQNQFSTTGEGKIILETVSAKNRYDSSLSQVIQRVEGDATLINGKVENPQKNLGDYDVEGENIQSIRFRVQGDLLPPWSFIIETYEDTFEAFQENSVWEKINDFSLTIEDNEAFSRLIGEQYIGTLNLPWQKFDSMAPLNAENYKDRWQRDEGLVKTIDEFINKSNDDPRALTNYTNSSNPDDPQITVSLLDMLKLASLDYHTARMLGLGHLDVSDVVIGNDERFIYAAVYTTFADLEYVGKDVDHIAMTLPTGYFNQRFSLSPVLKSIDYGLEIKDQDGNNTSSPFSDANGYSLYDQARFVKLNKTNQLIAEPVANTIPQNKIFDGTQVTANTCFGIKYKNSKAINWKAPEIMHDEVYVDINNIAEPILIPEMDNNPLYTHTEVEEGTHEYALYGINWFNRCSPLSNIEQTDETIFPIKQSLLPPFNVTVQYIQEEDPLIFTTQAEQDVLTTANDTNPTADNYQLRVNFEWDNIHANAYQYGDKAEFFFRENPPKKVEGLIKKVIDWNEEESMIETTGYKLASINPPKEIFPAIDATQVPLFLGSYLATTQGQFKIVGIVPSTTPPIGAAFRVKKIKTLVAVQNDPNEPYATIPNYISPKADDAFFVIENVDNPNQWVKLDQTVQLINHSSTIETVYTENAANSYSSKDEFVGGIVDDAKISHIPDSVNPHVDKTGGYRVIFSNSNLANHPQPNVSWFKGSARFKIAGKPTKKRLGVVKIENLNPLTIVVFDPDYFADINNRIEFTDKTNNNQLFQVSFHPGYRLYLNGESTTDFNKSHIVPNGNVNNKKTYFAVRSKDTTKNAYSALSNACTIVAKNIQPPVTPMVPMAASFATRPDVYSKSTYTFDIEFLTNNRNPYGAIVYRSNEIAILQALYKPSTVQLILAQLEEIKATDTFNVNRWNGLLKVDNEKPPSPFPGTHEFSFLTYGTYKFPVPDNADTELLLPDAETTLKPFDVNFKDCKTLSEYKKKVAQIKIIIDEVFNPVTETPIILEFLKDGKQTSNKKPTYKDVVGKLLDQNDPLFNPFPMAVRLSTSPYQIRFTDYTINGSSKNIYFYYIKEVSINMQLSKRTDAIGPIYLVDANPPAKPKIRSITVREQTKNVSPAIVFELSEYLASEKIEKIQIFRTTNFNDTTATRTMNLAATTSLDGTNMVADEFNDLEAPPFAQTLFYRIVALKKIINESNTEEYVPSDPSDVVYTNIFDATNPSSPELAATFTKTPATANQVEGLSDCTIKWTRDKGSYNAIFKVLKMNSQGNWEKIWTKKSNQNNFVFPENNDFTNFPVMAFLPKFDENGDEIFHRFKVEVENASGLLSGDENILIL